MGKKRGLWKLAKTAVFGIGVGFTLVTFTMWVGLAPIMRACESINQAMASFILY